MAGMGEFSERSPRSGLARSEAGGLDSELAPSGRRASRPEELVPSTKPSIAPGPPSHGSREIAVRLARAMPVSKGTRLERIALRGGGRLVVALAVIACVCMYGAVGLEDLGRVVQAFCAAMGGGAFALCALLGFLRAGRTARRD